MQQVRLKGTTIWATRSRLVACAILGTMLASLGQAGVFYVDVSSGSDSNSGTSQTTPWAHLPGTIGFSGSGWVTLQNGDTVYVKGGTINRCQVKFTTSYYGGSSAYDSIRVISGHLASSPWGSGRAVYDEENTRTTGFWVAGTSGVTLDGFEVRNIAAGGVGDGFDTSYGSCCIAVGGSAATYTKIRRCYLHDSLRNADDRGHGIETASGNSQLIIEFNTVGPNIGTKGIEMYHADYGIIRQNFVTGTGDHGIVISGNHWDVYNNLVSMKDGVHQPTYAIKCTHDYNDFWNNILFSASPPTDISGFGMGVGIGGGTGSNNRFLCNTVYQFGSTGNWGEEGVGIVFGLGQTAVTGNQVQNNLVFNSHNAIGGINLYYFDQTTKSTIKFNDFYYDTGIAATYGHNGGHVNDTVPQFQGVSFDSGTAVANNQQVNPQLTAGTLPSGLDANFLPNSGYFALTSTSPSALRASGNSSLTGDGSHGYSSASNKFATDILGATRVNWSMGAYEYGGAASPPPALPPLPPTNLRLAQAP